MNIGPLIAAVMLAVVYVASGWLHLGQSRRRRELLSAAAGITIAYVFVDLLPALARRQVVFTETEHRGLLFPEERIYIAALLGFLMFYSLEHMTVQSTDSAHREEAGRCGLTCFLDTVGFAFYSGLVAYFLSTWVRRESLALLFYTVAMGLHFLIVAHSLREEQGQIYDRTTRCVLAGAVLIGYVLGMVSGLPESLLDTMVGFIAGGVVINSINKEMPKEGEIRFRAFIIGALVYAALLLIAG